MSKTIKEVLEEFGNYCSINGTPFGSMSNDNEQLNQVLDEIQEIINYEINNSILSSLLEYYRYTRQVGHTTAMITGLKNSPLIMAANNLHKENLRQMGVPKDSIILPYVLHERLLGSNKPLLVDHFTLDTMFCDLKSSLEKRLK